MMPDLFLSNIKIIIKPAEISAGFLLKYLNAKVMIESKKLQIISI
jgi:hypothetical protein